MGGPLIKREQLLTELECTYCHETYSADEPHRVCDECGKVLILRSFGRHHQGHTPLDGLVWSS